MDATDVCFAPVLSIEEAPSHPHNAARSTFVDGATKLIAELSKTPIPKPLALAALARPPQAEVERSVRGRGIPTGVSHASWRPGSAFR